MNCTSKYRIARRLTVSARDAEPVQMKTLITRHLLVFRAEPMVELDAYKMSSKLGSDGEEN